MLPKRREGSNINPRTLKQVAHCRHDREAVPAAGHAEHQLSRTIIGARVQIGADHLYGDDEGLHRIHPLAFVSCVPSGSLSGIGTSPALSSCLGAKTRMGIATSPLSLFSLSTRVAMTIIASVNSSEGG